MPNKAKRNIHPLAEDNNSRAELNLTVEKELQFSGPTFPQNSSITLYTRDESSSKQLIKLKSGMLILIQHILNTIKVGKEDILKSHPRNGCGRKLYHKKGKSLLLYPKAEV